MYDEWAMNTAAVEGHGGNRWAARKKPTDTEECWVNIVQGSNGLATLCPMWTVPHRDFMLSLTFETDIFVLLPVPVFLCLQSSMSFRDQISSYR